MTRAETGPAVSVVVALYDRVDGLRRLLSALETQTFSDFEVIVVDQTGMPETEKLLTTSSLDALYLECIPSTDARTGRRRRGKPSNASRARNTGVNAARASIIAMTDDDCVPIPEWLERLTAPLRHDPSVLMVTGPRFVPETRPAPVETRHSGAQNPVLSRWQGGTSSLAFRRDVFVRVGGLDTAIGPGTDVFGAEDLHLIYRFLREADKARGCVVNRRDAAVADTEPVSGWGKLRKRWIYYTSLGMVLRREYAGGADPVARRVWWEKLWREHVRALPHAVREASPLWTAMVPVGMAGLLVGWLRGRRLPPFVPEL
jgi:glycosyltransferase involved in cell wall biosynthesis